VKAKGTKEDTKAVIFDFGGVLAEEGFREGLKAIARKNGLAPDNFFAVAENLIYSTGYVTGMSGEADFLNALREKTGITESDEEIREEILKRFILRPDVIRHVDDIRSSGKVTAMLSDQTDWLDELNERTPFYQHFDYVFNSFKIKKGKRDPSIFRDVCSITGFKPEEVIFIDDNINNVKRALGEGLKAIHFKDMESFKKEIGSYVINLQTY